MHVLITVFDPVFAKLQMPPRGGSRISKVGLWGGAVADLGGRNEGCGERVDKQPQNDRFSAMLE